MSSFGLSPVILIDRARSIRPFAGRTMIAARGEGPPHPAGAPQMRTNDHTAANRRIPPEI
jgi:hypothetical protein